MGFLQKGTCIALVLIMAQSVTLTSLAAETSKTPSTAVVQSQSVNAAAKQSPTKVSLNKTSANLVVGKKITLKATLTPAKATTKLTWSSSNKKVATVSASGTVTGVKKGTATITVRTANGKTATCKITVISQNDAYVNEVIRLVNVEREKRGLKKLSKNTKVCSAANKRAKEITQKFSHTRPNGKECFTVLSEYGVRSTYSGENIAMGSPTPKDVVKLWMDSKGHKANILNPNFKSMGVGVAEKNGAKYWVQLFVNC